MDYYMFFIKLQCGLTKMWMFRLQIVPAIQNPLL